MLAKFVTIFVLAAGILVQAQANLYEGTKVFELKVQHAAQLNVLTELVKNEQFNYEFFSSPKLQSTTRILVQSKVLKTFKDFLVTNNIQHQLINDNFHAAIESELNTQRILKNLKPYRPGQRLGTERYYSHGEINQYIEDLAQRYPKRVQVKTVGKSFEGRPLKTITITNGDGRKNKQAVFMDAGIHAREWIAPAVAVYAIGELVENFKAHADILLDYDWIVLPVVNPDGYEYTQFSVDTRLWRKTRQPSSWNGTEVLCYGTDCNRNFGYHWSETGSSDDPCSNTYAGPYAFSEPEAVVVRDLVHTLKGRGVMYLTLHSQGKLLLYPWGYSSDIPDTWEDLQAVGDAGADAIKQATGTIYTVGHSTTVLYAAAGASDDYAFSEGFKQSFTMELPGGGNSGFDPPPQSIDSYVKESWIGIRAMGKKINEMYPL